MFRVTAFFAATIVSASLIAAQTQKKPAARRPPAKAAATARPAWPIDSLAVEGNRNYTEAQILQVSGLKVGQKVTKGDFDAARDRLIATGVFENVGYRYEPSASSAGYAATLQVQEVEPVYPYRFEELPASREELEAVLHQSDLLLGKRIPATETLLKRYSTVLESYLAPKGFKEKVTAKVTLENVNDLMVVFRPTTAPETIAEVRFNGASIVPQTELQRAIHGVAVGTVYQESRLRQVLENSLRPVYEERGRIRVSFPKIGKERAKDVKGLIITVSVNEGESYTLGDVTVEGAKNPKGTFKTGEVANMQKVQEGIEKIRESLRRDGYLKASSTVERKLDDQKRILNLAIRFEPGAQYKFKSMRIEGLDIIGEAAIKKMWGLKEGQPFDSEYPDYFLRTVKEAGMFDNLKQTKSATKLDEDAKTADVVLYFR